MRRLLSGVMLASAVAAQQTWTVPAAHDSADAPAALTLAGQNGSLRQQVILGSGLLAPMLGHTLTGLTFRRDAVDEAFGSGTCTLTVTLAHAPVTPQNARQTFSANLGSSPQVVYAGGVSFPASAAAPTTPGWTASNTVHIAFANPFSYQGGPLAVDLVGQSSAAGPFWWSVDAVGEDLQGTTQRLGSACSTFADPQADTSFVNPRDLVAGGTINFLGQGAPFSLGVLVLGAPAAMPIPLAALGLPATPDCTCQIHPAVVLATMIALYLPSPEPLIPSTIGFAQAELAVPSQTWALGMSLASQWIELPSTKASNGILFTLAAQMPALDTALIVGSPQEAKGQLNLQLAPVIRFDYQ